MCSCGYIPDDPEQYQRATDARKHIRALLLRKDPDYYIKLMRLETKVAREMGNEALIRC
jgi:hypothetical protein